LRTDERFFSRRKVLFRTEEVIMVELVCSHNKLII
jgi:hypothetical protein